VATGAPGAPNTPEEKGGPANPHQESRPDPVMRALLDLVVDAGRSVGDIDEQGYLLFVKPGDIGEPGGVEGVAAFGPQGVERLRLARDAVKRRWLHLRSSVACRVGRCWHAPEQLRADCKSVRHNGSHRKAGSGDLPGPVPDGSHRGKLIRADVRRGCDTHTR
jgi:hypothetical protein